jgi:hypothetical protein
MLKSKFKLKRHLRRANEPKRLQELNGLSPIKGLESVIKLVFKHVELSRDLDDDIRLAHLTIPIPDPETQEDVQEDTQETIPEGFGAGDPKNWMQEEQVHHSKTGFRMNLFHLKRRRMGYLVLMRVICHAMCIIKFFTELQHLALICSVICTVN